MNFVMNGMFWHLNGIFGVQKKWAQKGDLGLFYPQFCSRCFGIRVIGNLPLWFIKNHKSKPKQQEGSA